MLFNEQISHEILGYSVIIFVLVILISGFIVRKKCKTLSKSIKSNDIRDELRKIIYSRLPMLLANLAVVALIYLYAKLG